MTKFLQALTYAAFYLVSLLPYRALYVLADVLHVVVYDVARYRVKVVRRNLATSFPEKSPEELKKVERGFYRWLCDYFVETVKLISVSRKELLRHVESAASTRWRRASTAARRAPAYSATTATGSCCRQRASASSGTRRPW